MLSICIPAFNYDIRLLVQSLHRQAEAANISYEIIVIDDDSEERFKHQNCAILSLKNVVYTELSENIGRAAIRNLLAKTAKYPYLIFMDCDAELPDNAFLSRYLALCTREIICYGGRTYAPSPLRTDWFFRWHYGVQRECPSADLRNLHPNRSFITFNFLVSKSIMERLTFDTELTGYGHEDTLFGYSLSRADIQVTHIDNPLIHVGLENSFSFIQKTENGIRNLLFLYKKTNYNRQLADDIKLLRYYIWCKKYDAHLFIVPLFRLFKPLFLKNLHGKTPNLVVFDLYKLGFMLRKAEN
ncbi:MAG: hypothetical protein RI894_1848 [Bacteroidota bacterium]|jgi:glycosyltransferase involved in cell wall biosynthesis